MMMMMMMMIMLLMMMIKLLLLMMMMMFKVSGLLKNMGVNITLPNHTIPGHTPVCQSHVFCASSVIDYQ